MGSEIGARGHGLFAARAASSLLGYREHAVEHCHCNLLLTLPAEPQTPDKSHYRYYTPTKQSLSAGYTPHIVIRTPESAASLRRSSFGGSCSCSQCRRMGWTSCWCGSRRGADLPAHASCAAGAALRRGAASGYKRQNLVGWRRRVLPAARHWHGATADSTCTCQCGRQARRRGRSGPARLTLVTIPCYARQRR
jgi:hypothetical protein